jgi:hypothetical protein
MPARLLLEIRGNTNPALSELFNSGGVVARWALPP